MSRLSALLLAAALILTGVIGPLQAQAPQGAQGGQGQQAPAIPDGAGKELVARASTNSTGYSKERWQYLLSTKF